MAEEERLQTLEDLLASKKATNNLLEKLPIAVKSLKMQDYKKSLEEKLNKLERAIETFSKKKVYV